MDQYSIGGLERGDVWSGQLLMESIPAIGLQCIISITINVNGSAHDSVIAKGPSRINVFEA